MLFGICNLSSIPIRAEASHLSEMTNQMLFGEHFTVIDTANKQWLKISLAFDGFIGFIDAKQCKEISKTEFDTLENKTPVYSAELLDFIIDAKNALTTIPLGATLPNYTAKKFSIANTNFEFDNAVINGIKDKATLLKIAYTYLNAPYLWGGKTPFGIDCSGFIQMVYKLYGHALPRNAKDQAKQGTVLSFIEECEPGDLAFFDDEEGHIIHVGIILNNYTIIHAFGKVRIDTLDHSGIFNTELQKHTHKLRVLKKII